jgi:opacity protein-like surface antigen
MLVALCLTWTHQAAAADSDAQTAPAVVGQEASGPGKKETEVYLGLFMLGTMPSNRPLEFQEEAFPNTSVDGGLGGGIKVGMYPGVARGFVGVEAELSGFNGNVSVPPTTSGGVTRSGSFVLNVFNAMANLLFRYPGERVQPYLGAGIGLSGAFARDINVQHSLVGNINENAGDAAFAYQLIGGGRVKITDRVFLFSEYKYMVANYKWDSELFTGASGPSFSLPFRTHIISGGVGFNF